MNLDEKKSLESKKAQIPIFDETHGLNSALKNYTDFVADYTYQTKKELKRFTVKHNQMGGYVPPPCENSGSQSKIASKIL